MPNFSQPSKENSLSTAETKEYPLTRFRNGSEELNQILENTKNNRQLREAKLKELKEKLIKEKLLIEDYFDNLINRFSKEENANEYSLSLLLIKYQKQCQYQATIDYLKEIHDKFYQNFSVIQEIKTDFDLNDDKWFEKVFHYKGKFKEKPEVSLTPISIAIKFNTREDLQNFTKFVSKSYDPTNKLGFVVPKTTTTKGTLYHGLNIINNAAIKNMPDDLQKHTATVQHEYLHNIQYVLEQNSTTKKNAPRSEKELLDNFTERLKNEILAFYGSNNLTSTEEVQKYLQNNYDGLAVNLAQYNQYGTYLSLIANDFQVIMGLIPRYLDALDNEIKSLKEKYVKMGLDVIKKLEKAGFTKKEIVTHLINEPLLKWNLTAQRLINNKDLLK